MRLWVSLGYHPVMPETAPNLLMTALVRTLVLKELVPEGQMVRAWLDSWSGIGHVVDAMHAIGYNVDPLPWRAVQRAALETLRQERAP